MKFSKFLETYKVGKSYAYDGTYKGECVSLVKNYIKYVLGVNPVSIGDAKNYWLRRNEPYLQELFKPLRDGEIPRKGDLFVRVSGTYGHIGIVLNANKDGFTAYEQNYNGCRVVKKIYHEYAGDTHFLRPRNEENIMEKKNRPTVKAGKTYYFSTQPWCYKDTAKKGVYLINEITNLTSGEKARLQSGTKVKPDKVIEVGKDIWIAYTKKGKTVYSLVYNYAKDKAYIK